MKIEKIYFEQLFPTGNFSNVRMGMEISMEENDVVLEAYDSAKKLVNASFNALHPEVTATLHDFNTGQPSSPQTAKEEWEDAMIKEIGKMNQIDEVNAIGVQTGLLAYSTAASQSQRVKDAYEKRMEELSC